MGQYKLSETEVLTQPSEYIDEKSFTSLFSYETTEGDADGGYLDQFNSLKEQIDFNYVQYKEQLRGLVQRSESVRKDMSDAFRQMLILFLIPIVYALFLQLFMYLGLYVDFFAAIFVILHILFYAVLVLCYFIFLPGFTKNFINFYGRYKVLNSSDKMKNYRESNRIISFQDEKDFLKDKIKEYDSFYEEVMIQGLDKRDGALGGNDSGVLTSDQTMVLDKMRKLSVFRECKASVGETKKDISIGFVVGCVVITTTVLLAFLNFKAGNHF